MSHDVTTIDDMDYDHIAIALDKYEQRADEIRRMLSHLYAIHENYSSLYKRLLTFDKRIKHQTFIPFGSHAFIPGQIVNTNMLTVFLGEGYYREMSTPDTVLLIQKRITGLQNEIATYHREMQSFGHHIQNLHSILGKPLHTPSLSDRMAEKLTGQASSLNTEEVDITQFRQHKKPASQQISKPRCNPRDPTASLQPTRATRTTQGKNEDGDDIVDIVEYFEGDIDVKPTRVQEFNHTQHEPQLFKAFPDMPDFQPQNYTTNADGELVLKDEHKAQIKDVFYESLDRTLKEFENSRIDAQELTQDEIDEIERIEREIMGDLYVPPTTTTTMSVKTKDATKNTEKKQVQFDDQADIQLIGGKSTANFLDEVFSTVNPTSVRTHQPMIKLETKDDEGDLMMDQVLIPTSRSHVQNVTAEDFRNELAIPMQSLKLTRDTEDALGSNEMIPIGSNTKKSGFIEIVDDGNEHQSKQLQDSSQATNQSNSETTSIQDLSDYDAYMAYMQQQLGAFQELEASSSTNEGLVKQPTVEKSGKSSPSSTPKPHSSTTPSNTKPIQTTTDQLINDTVAVRQRPARKPTTTNTRSSTTPSVSSTQSPPSAAPKPQPTPTSAAPSQVASSRAITKPSADIDQPSTSDAYLRYLESIQSRTTHDFFAQFLQDLDEDDDYGDDQYHDEDGDDYDEDHDDELFFQNMKKVYANLYNQPSRRGDQSNTQNNSFNRSSTTKHANNTGPDGKQGAKRTGGENVIDPYENQPEGDEEYMNLFWNHMQSIVDEQEQRDLQGGREQESKLAPVTPTHLDDIDDGDSQSISSLPPQDRPVYSTFGLGQMRDGTHALVPKSIQSTTYTSDLLTKKPPHSASGSSQTDPNVDPTPKLKVQPQAPKMSLFKQKRLGLLDQNNPE